MLLFVRWRPKEKSVYIAEQEGDENKNQGRQEKLGGLLRVFKSAGLALLLPALLGVWTDFSDHQTDSPPVGAKPLPHSTHTCKHSSLPQA